ncbi:MAG: hypothetical protein P8Z74_08080, partial [Acidobacteriota bacterium]
TSSSLDELDIVAVRLDTGQTKTLLHGGYWPRYLATSDETGYLVYVHGSTLFGVGFDPRRLELRGTPTPLLDDLGARADRFGGGQFAFSHTGTLVYLSGRQGDSWPLSWLDAAGKTTPLVAQPGTYGAPRLSPDGKRLAYIAQGGKGSDVWVYDRERGTPTQLTFLGSVNVELAWARDSKHLVYGDGTALWWIRADGAGQRQLLLDKRPAPRPGSFTPDGRLAFAQLNAGLPDVYTLPIDLSDPEHPKPGKAEPFLAEPDRVAVDPAFSPDGKFLAYASNQEGVEQVFVRSFPGPGGEWKVSTAGGKFPAWCAATHELFFLGSDDRIMIASYSIEGDTFRAGVPHAWSPTQVRRINFWQQNFDVSPDGKHVVMMPRPVSEDTGGSLHATFLLNFFDELRRRVPLD